MKYSQHVNCLLIRLHYFSVTVFSQNQVNIAKLKSQREGIMTIGIGKRVKKLRKKAEWTQTEFSEKIGTSLNTLSKFENGTSDLPSECIKKAAELLGVTPNYLLNGKEEIEGIKKDELELLELYRNDQQVKTLLNKIVENKKKIIDSILQELPIAA
jgi:transcriptional regulator with XRE-family HTH domain